MLVITKHFFLVSMTQWILPAFVIVCFPKIGFSAMTGLTLLYCSTCLDVKAISNSQLGILHTMASPLCVNYNFTNLY